MLGFRISQCRANSHGKPLSFLSTPSGELGFATRSHSRTTPVPNECCPHFASGSCPWENYSAIDSGCPPRSHSRERLRHRREWLHYERSVPPRTDLSLRGFSCIPRTKSHSRAQGAQLLANGPCLG